MIPTENLKRFYKSKAFLFLTIGIYAFLVFLTIFNHEPWRDEAQVWLLVSDLNLGGLIRELPYNGHPFLWYILVFPLAKAGLPYVSMGILHGILALAAAWFFLKKAPFPLFLRVLFVFSYFMLYEYAAIARNYVISVLLLFLLADLFKNRHNKPLLFGLFVALLCNTNTHSFFAAGAMGMLFLWSLVKSDKTIRASKTQWLSLVIMLLGTGCAYFSIKVQPDGWQPWLSNPMSWQEPLDAVGNAFLPTCLTNPGMTLFFKHWSVNVFFLTFVVLAIISIRKSKNAVVFFLIATSGLLYILVFRYSGYLRHYGLILIFLLTAFWIFVEETDNREKRESLLPADSLFSGFVMGFLALSLFVSMLLGLNYMVKDIRYPFSGAKEMATYIKERNIANEVIAAYNIHTITAIYPYLPGISFWDPGLGKSFRFIHWDKAYSPTRQLSEPDFMHRSLTQVNGRNTYYVLLTKPLSDPQSYGMALDFKVDSEQITGDEKYYLYKNIK